MQKVGLIVACDLVGTIAYDGKIPWHNKEDMRRFKEITMGSVVIMGLNTYNSLPDSKLPGRIKYVLDYHKHDDSEDTKWFTGIDKALLAADENIDIWIIGGRQVYEDSLACDIPDIIDLTILNCIHLNGISEPYKICKEKTLKLPNISFVYMVEKEWQNENDPLLFHRRYIKRPGGFGSSFIQDIRKKELEKIKI
jgi:dihydrofolate reductase